MSMTYRTTPTPEELRTLSTPELGVIILRSRTTDLNVDSSLRAHEQAHAKNNEPDTQHPLERYSDAWAWLIGNGLVGPHTQHNTSNWYRVTDRGREVAESNSLTSLMADQRLPDDLHERLAEARRQFRSGNSELSVFEAMKQVEVRIRELSGAGNDEIGVNLARNTFHPETGPLSDQRLESGERSAIGHLFAGALGAFKNPTSHRVVNFDDPARAADAVLLADLLMRMLDEVEVRLQQDGPS